MVTRFLHPLARIGRLPRILAAAACLLLAAVSALDGSAPGRARAPSGPTAAVVVATRALPAGHVVTRADVTVRRWPRAVRPATARADPNRVVGRRLAGPVGAREPVTSVRLLGRDLTAGLGPAAVAVPVTVDTDVAGLIHAGDRVDLLAVPRPELLAPGAGHAPAARRVAEAARVLAVFDAGEPSGAPAGTQLVLAVNRPIALELAGLRTSQMFTVVGDSP